MYSYRWAIFRIKYFLSFSYNKRVFSIKKFRFHIYISGSCHKNEKKTNLRELGSNLGTGKNCTGPNSQNKMDEESIQIRVYTEFVFFSFFAIAKSFP